MLGDLVIYNDAIISLAELQAIANQSNFATPFTANASLVSHWKLAMQMQGRFLLAILLLGRLRVSR